MAFLAGAAQSEGSAITGHKPMPRKHNERRYAFGGPRTESPLRKMGSIETSSRSG